MKRRSAIKTISLGMGYTLTAAGMATFISGCKQDGSVKAVSSEWTPAFMTSEQAGLIENILDAYLPTTASSPGYKAVSAIQMFDNTINKLWKKKDQGDFTSGLVQLATRFSDDHGSDVASFMKAHMGPQNSDAKGRVATEEENEMFDKLIGNLRSLGIGTYFSNETIASEYLAYDPVPGRYDGCIDLTPDQNSWS